MVGDPNYNTAARNVVISASTALAVMLIELGLLVGDEIKHIWPRLWSSWKARIYVSARYAGLISQIFNVYFAVRMYLGIYTSPTGCRVWFMYQAVLIQALLACAEGLLMLRLYALFLKSRMVFLVLLSFVLAQCASMVVSARLSFPSNKYTVSCWMTRSNPGNAFFSATTMTTNVIIFFMAFWRYCRLPTKWTREGLGRAIVFDSALSLIAISVIMLFLTLCSLEVIKPSMSGNVTFSWLVCILWASIGRIIINHEKIPRDEQGVSTTWKGTVQLTSQIEMGESVLTLDTQCASTNGAPTSTLQGSLSTPMSKASQFSPSSVCTSNGPQWFGDVPIVHGYVCRRTLQPSGTPSGEESVPNASQTSSLSGHDDTSGGNASSTEDHPQAGLDVPEHGHRLNSSMQPSDAASVKIPGLDSNLPSPSGDRTGTSDGGAARTGDHVQVDAAPREYDRSSSPCSSPRSSSSELPSLQVCS